MAYVYSPSGRFSQGTPTYRLSLANTNFFFNFFKVEIAVTKDNPAFSMINDSDEEVVYGSEDESRRPLTLSGKNDYDSD